MSAPNLPNLYGAPPKAASAPAATAPQDHPPSSSSSHETGADEVVAAPRPTSGTVRLPKAKRDIPVVAKLAAVLAILAIGGLTWSNSRPDPVTITGSVGSVINPDDLLPVFTEVVDEPVAGETIDGSIEVVNAPIGADDRVGLAELGDENAAAEGG